MAVYLARSCPRFRNYFGVIIGEPQTISNVRPIPVVALPVDTKSTGRRFVQVMAQSAIDKIPPGPKLDALTAERVFGWNNVHKHEDSLVGKKQDKAGHWRLAKVPYYSTNPVHALSVDDRMKQLGRLERYQKELAKIARSKDMPSEWASPDQRCRAAIKAVGRYGQVIPLRRNLKRPQK
jgi:hypothetical protein